MDDNTLNPYVIIPKTGREEPYYRFLMSSLKYVAVINDSIISYDGRRIIIGEPPVKIMRSVNISFSKDPTPDAIHIKSSTDYSSLRQLLNHILNYETTKIVVYISLDSRPTKMSNTDKFQLYLVFDYKSFSNIYGEMKLATVSSSHDRLIKGMLAPYTGQTNHNTLLDVALSISEKVTNENVKLSKTSSSIPLKAVLVLPQDTDIEYEKIDPSWYSSLSPYVPVITDVKPLSIDTSVIHLRVNKKKDPISLHHLSDVIAVPAIMPIGTGVKFYTHTHYMLLIKTQRTTPIVDDLSSSTRHIEINVNNGYMTAIVDDRDYAIIMTGDITSRYEDIVSSCLIQGHDIWFNKDTKMMKGPTYEKAKLVCDTYGGNSTISMLSELMGYHNLLPPLDDYPHDVFYCQCMNQKETLKKDMPIPAQHISLDTTDINKRLDTIENLIKTHMKPNTDVVASLYPKEIRLNPVSLPSSPLSVYTPYSK